MMHEYIMDHKPQPDNAQMHSDDRTGTRAIITALMAKHGFTSERALAEAAGIDQSSFNRYMREETAYLSIKSLQALAEILQCTSSQLLGETPLEDDPKVAKVLRAMETLPEYMKDVIVATSKTLLDSKKPPE
jgi:transcriptional regulator with XRE-family HTH domain